MTCHVTRHMNTLATKVKVLKIQLPPLHPHHTHPPTLVTSEKSGHCSSVYAPYPSLTVQLLGTVERAAVLGLFLAGHLNLHGGVA